MKADNHDLDFQTDRNGTLDSHEQRPTPANNNVQAIYSQKFSAHRKFLLLLFISKTLAFLDKGGSFQGNDKASQFPGEKKGSLWSWRIIECFLRKDLQSSSSPTLVH